ncbi:MAG: sigma-54-dependent Fis family transcriptional regulator [Acidobacteria bacterium]|jgi:DNA-binding NtrC family response regulator|nr:sigma-54-dependent Fis family transcriptional regulator [Acidobacteriota bacterium]
MAQGKILILEDEKENLQSLMRALEKVGYEVKGFQDPAQGLDYLRGDESVDIVVTDLKMPGIDGIEVLRQVKKNDPSMAVLLVTAFGSVESAVQAMKVGADDYLSKPVDIYELRSRVKSLVDKRKLSIENDELKARLDERFGFENIVGNSQAMRSLFQQTRMVAATRATVLIRGESGTGKELIANAIHHHSDRKRGRFLPLNCAAIPPNLIESELFGHEKGSFTGADKAHPGKFELAHGGTLFLDEIGELSLDLQAKLLRVLEEHAITRVGGAHPISVDVRIITATNRDLLALVREGRFREDLYYRLKVVELSIPPLRDRLEDLPLLVQAFLNQFNKEHGKQVKRVSDGVIKALAAHRWPGNVRELKNVIERMVIFSDGDLLEERHLPSDFGGGDKGQPAAPSPVAVELQPRQGAVVPLDEMEREAIMSALRQMGGNKTQAARALGIGLRTLHRKLKDYGYKDVQEPNERSLT